MKEVLATKDARSEVLETKVTRLEALELKVEELKVKNQQQEEKFVALQRQIDERSVNLLSSHPIIHPSSAESSDNKTAVAASGIPKSCADLRYLGHSASGLYLIMGTVKVETVYCDFSVLPSNTSKCTFHVLFTKRRSQTKVMNNSKVIRCDLQISKSGLDKLTSNRLPFTFTFRD